MDDLHRIRVGRADVWLLGTIAGFVPDADRVRRALEEVEPARIALGVPPEDLEGLRTLAQDPDVELPDLDPASERFFEWLEPFGKTRVPSPDLDAAFAGAAERELPVEALDLDDEDHAEVYIRANKFRHVIQSGRVQKKLLKHDFGDHEDAHSLAVAWDAFQNQLPSLQTVETAREEHMAERLREVAAAGGPVLAVVPVARLEGVVAALRGPTEAPA